MKNKKITLIFTLLLVMLLIAACDFDPVVPPVEDLNTIVGEVTYNGQPVEGVEVTLVETGETVLTDAEGKFVFAGLEDGTYEFKLFKEEDNIDFTGPVDLVGGGNTEYTFNLSEEEGINDIEQLINDINNYGIHLNNTYNQQIEKIAENIEEKVIPYTELFGRELAYTLRFAETFFYMEDFYWYANPGYYQLNQFGEFEYLEENSQDDIEDNVWILNINEEEKIRIEMINADELITVEENDIYVDFSKAYFNYTHIIGEPTETAYHLELDIEFDDVRSVVTYIDTNDYKYIIPKDFSLSLIGNMFSGNTYYDIEDIILGNIDLNLYIDSQLNFTSEEQYLYINGNFDSDIISFEGNLEFDFESVPSLVDLAEGEEAIFERIGLDDAYFVVKDVFELEGIFNLYLAFNNEEMKGFELIGRYEEYNSSSNPVIAEGELNFEVVDFENMLAKLSFEGTLEGDFKGISLEFFSEIIENVYEGSHSSEITLYYGDDQFLCGTIEFEYIEKNNQSNMLVNLENEKGLVIDFEIDFNDIDDRKIGEIKSAEGDVLADIIIDDYQATVIIRNSDKVIRILPQL
ncbi:carboxypeptidase-like regulatory domain-containing protein [Natronospora cellulosivora (SeqCode)]